MKCVIFVIVLIFALCQAEVPEIPDLDDFDAIKERCDKKGGNGTYDKIKSAQQETQKCIKDIIDVETIKTEVEEAKKTGSMDEVFGKYCGKRPQIRECIKKTYDAIQPCLEQNEKQALNATESVVTQISDFACYRDGDRIAMFVAEGGVECLSSRVESIKNCVNETVKFNPATFSPNGIPSLTIDKKKCDDLTTIQNCIVKDLEDHCSSSTPANVVDALFRFVKKSVCKNIKRKRSIRSNGALQNVATRENFLKALVKTTCEKNGGEAAFEKLVAAVNESQNCLSSYRLFVTPYDTYKVAMENCTINARNALKNCLNKEGKYYADYILEISQALYGVLYSNVKDVLQNRQPNAEFTSCITALNQEQTQKSLLKCLERHSTLEDDPKLIIIPPKSQFCEQLTETFTCISNIVNTVCIKDLQITKLLNDVLEALQTPCRERV